MQILPVLDLMHGQVVRGVAGHRESYQPIQSVLTASSDPLLVATALQKQLGLSQFYVADLDAIREGKPQRQSIQTLADVFPKLWLDCGLRNADGLTPWLDNEELIFVAGLETISGPKTLQESVRRLGSHRVVLSLDLKEGKPLGTLEHWQTSEPIEIARQAIEQDITQMIVLDLADVGVSQGVSTVPLCQQIKKEFPETTIIAGGGVRTATDLNTLNEANLDGVLVASGFHNGTIKPEDLKPFHGEN